MIKQIQPINKIFMIQRKITQPQPLQIKILTQFNPNLSVIRRPKKNDHIAQITIYTDKHIFEGNLQGQNVNQQLAWNSESLATLTECLMGKRQNIQVVFSPLNADNKKHNINQKNNNNNNKNPKTNKQDEKVKQSLQSCTYNFQMVCQIKSGINLSLFKLIMNRVQNKDKISPFLHMKKKFAVLQSNFKTKQQVIKQQQDKLKQQLKQIQGIQKQIIDSSTVQINVMKTNFVKIINQCKQQIRKYISKQPLLQDGIVAPIKQKLSKSFGKIQEVQQQSQQLGGEKSSNLMYASKQKMKSRNVKLVDRKAYQRTVPQMVEIQVESEGYEQDISQKPLKIEKTFLKEQQQLSKLNKDQQKEQTNWDQLFQ